MYTYKMYTFEADFDGPCTAHTDLAIFAEFL